MAEPVSEADSQMNLSSLASASFFRTTSEVTNGPLNQDQDCLDWLPAIRDTRLTLVLDRQTPKRMVNDPRRMKTEARDSEKSPLMPIEAAAKMKARKNHNGSIIVSLFGPRHIFGVILRIKETEVVLLVLGHGPLIGSNL